MGSMTSRSRTNLSAVVLAVSLAAVLSACGGGGSKAATAPPPTTTGGTTGAGGASSGAGTGAGAFPGASGSVAAISGTSMEVQNPSTGQTTVNWTPATTFSQISAVAVTALTPGSCVTVTGTTLSGQITARSVSVTPAPASGDCSPLATGAAGRFGAGRSGGRFARSGAGGGAAGSVPSGSVPARTLPAGVSISVATGKLVSASATSLVIDGHTFNGFGGRRTRASTAPTSTPPTTTAPADITVQLTPTTTIGEIRAVTASDLAVGDCVVAAGPADSTGAVTARTVRITSTGGQTCTTGGGRFGGGVGTGTGASGANA